MTIEIAQDPINGACPEFLGTRALASTLGRDVILLATRKHRETVVRVRGCGLPRSGERVKRGEKWLYSLNIRDTHSSQVDCAYQVQLNNFSEYVQTFTYL